ncbi:AF4/FMR2 family member 2 [Hypomesus transpacificus]|uniref:AF4/FMR2 family member 2 n=1 Tax=Hypomesus transpacificus TaxID=137520 RepID=UPI001F086392|nr:AF4/FMR2 family member 2 [Hypomesus transpacificus]
MLEDDLKISSDEEDSEQQASDKIKPRTSTLSLPVAASRPADQGHSSGASGSSSESESSSESDSDSERAAPATASATAPPEPRPPEPEPPSTNKWQLDKWLNKVTPHNKSLVTPQPESHVPPVSSQPTHNLASESPAPGVKTKPGNPTPSLALPDPKNPRGLLSPDKAKPKAVQRAPEGQRSKGKFPGVAGAEPAAPRRSTGKKQPRKVERSSSLDDQQQHHPPWPRPTHSSLPTNPPREKDPPPPPLPLEAPRPRTKAPSGKTAPRKEPRNTSTTSTPTPPAPAPPAPPPPAPPAPPVDKKKHRGPSKIVPKSKEFIETESSSSSECHSDPEEPGKVLLPPGPGPSTTGSLGSLGGLKPKECITLGSTNLSVTSLGSSSSTSIPDPGGVGDLEDPEALFSPTPLGQTHLLSPLRDLEHIKSLWVKIELSFLTRIPGQEVARNPTPPPPPVVVHAVSAKMAETREGGAKHRRQVPSSSTPVQKPPSKSKRKHKSEHCEAVNGSKKLRLEADSLLLPPCISPIHNHKSSGTKDSLRRQSRKEKLLPPLLSPLSDEPPRQGRPSECSSSFGQDGGASGPITSTFPALGLSLPPCSSSSSSTSSSSSHKHRRGDGKAFSHSKTSSEEDTHGKPCSGFHGNGQSDSDMWSNPSSMSMEQAEPRRPKLTFNNTVHSADYYMQEAKKLKHKADALMEKFGKAVNYADGALSFIECGNAMERDPLEAKSPYTMYSETVELIRYAMRLKNFTSHSATVAEKKLAVLCNRCLSLLYLRMFKLKKDHAVKYSRSLMEYFKNSSKSSQAPSPWGANGKSTGTPSPLSLSPSPVSSVCSSGGGGPSGQTGSAPSGSVAIPQRIHHMAASHVNITNNILRSYEHWDTAERLAVESHEFFEELDSVLEPLSQLSSMTDLVRYIRQGLHWLRIEAHLL